ncbi:hypothetical protein [Streptomyces smyrnaeus]|uniref:hypothetical protein n=1 Tax=Streptomyces smyrnaeus TaxID=1387713 RepID=UPI0015D483E0
MSRMTIRVSHDDGRTWSRRRTLRAGTRSEKVVSLCRRLRRRRGREHRNAT